MTVIVNKVEGNGQPIKKVKNFFLLTKLFMFFAFFISRILFLFQELILEIEKKINFFISWSTVAQDSQ